jgi:thiamine biosynthesis lipoprotein
LRMTTSGDKTVRRCVWGALALIVGVCGLLSLWTSTEDEPVGLVSFSGPTMGTRYSVSLAPGTEPTNWPSNLQEVQQQVDERLAKIDRLMSTYDSESELSRFNRLNNNDWFAVSEETAQVVAAALEIAERTSGAFDPTIGPVVNLWGFGPDKHRPKLPSDGAIAEAMARVGYERVSVRIDPPALKKTHSDVYLDLSGIAKGFACDAISALLDELGFANTMVEIGGEVRTRGAKADGSPWRIGVEQPDNHDGKIHSAVNLVDGGMATSGDYRNFFQFEGVRYSHTIDPAIGRSVTHLLAAVSVVAPTCMEADALATALLVMGDEKGYDWCQEQNIAAMFLVRRDEQIVHRVTPGFQQRIASKAE